MSNALWLTGKLAPDFKTIADFRRDNGAAIRVVCRQFVILCREIGLIPGGTVAVDGSRFKAVNTRDKNYTPGAIRLRTEQVDASIARYLAMLDTADRQEDQVVEMRISRLSELAAPSLNDEAKRCAGMAMRSGDLARHH